MEKLEKIAISLKESIGDNGIYLNGNQGMVPYGPVFISTLYEIKEDTQNNIIITYKFFICQRRNIDKRFEC